MSNEEVLRQAVRLIEEYYELEHVKRITEAERRALIKDAIEWAHALMEKGKKK